MSRATLASLAPPTLDQMVDRVTEISSIPDIAMKVMEIANDENSSALDMKLVIETDPSLSARVLRVVNSTAYALREKVSNLQRAISLLGLKQIRSLALTASVAEMFKKNETIGSYNRCDLWKHLVAVGIGSRLIAMRQKMPDFEDVFLAGLLHDIGIVLEDQFAHQFFRRVVDSLEGCKSLLEAEREHLGFDHCRLGTSVAESWRFSDKVKAAIGYHHKAVNYRGDEVNVVRCVEVANLICTLKGYSSVGKKLVNVSQPTLNALSLTKEHIVVLARDLDEEFAKNEALFEI